MRGKIFGKPIITQEEMRKRIKTLGQQITTDYTDKNLLMVGVLKGAFAFFSDLTRAVRLPLHVDFLIVSRSGAKGKSTRSVKIISDIAKDLSGQDVLLVEDIVDSGATLTFLKKKMMARKPRSIKCCTLLDKPRRREVDVTIDYVGFVIPDQYVVGYGLDFENKYRNLPYIAVLDKMGERTKKT
ncbi:MAG: hypoxanthine phosphoribosyltransferase [Nitrospira sp.]|nr:hypoxanthine phosphoribosyltransferase [Candidatus Manganitrophaceae bacterium]HIL35554.1 hypoxanthine phosphoribosyltransferase [Candidatus Manganitrophaceae bacterium]